jgi:PAS domain S-box-containing protein
VRKKTEIALHESEDRLRLVIEAAELGTWDFDIVNGIANHSPRHDQLFGYKEPQSEWSYEISVKHMLPEYYSIAREAETKAIETGKLFYEAKILWPDGSTHWIAPHGKVYYDSNGKPLRMAGIVSDITERKIAEEAGNENQQRLKGIFDYAALGIAEVDQKDRFINVNNRLCDILGYTREELLGKAVFDIIVPEDLPHSHEINMKIHYGELDVFDYEKRYIKSDGTRIWVHVSISAVRDYMGQHLRTIRTIEDITSRKIVEEALKESKNRLQELNSTKDKLFSILSHDLKVPFTSIVGFSELLIENIRNKDFEDIENFATVISESSQNAMNLLTNLIDWSRLQTGTIKFNPEVFDLNTIISEVMGLLQTSAQKKSIVITSDVPSGLNVFADKFMINTVLRNLISNALKFTYPDGKILISAEKNETEVLIKVIDNGVGMSQEAIEKLFRFSNYSTPGTQNEKGTGLGMILVEEFVTKHKGKIRVESEIGKGSSFIFTLPL